MHGPVFHRVRRRRGFPEHAPAMQSAMNADRYCAYNLTRQRFVASNLEAADGTTSRAEARLLEIGPGEETALWILPYRKISASSTRFPLDLVLLDSDSVVLETVEFFPMNVVCAANAQATSLLVLAADSVARGEIKPGDQLAISAPEEMMLYLQRAQNDSGHLPETVRVIPWPKNGAMAEEQPATAKEAHKADGVEPGKPCEGAVTEAAARPPEKEESAIAASESPESAPAEVVTELPVHEEAVVAASEPSESTRPQIAAEFSDKDEPVAAMGLHSQVAPMPAQAESPWEDAPAQEPHVVPLEYRPVNAPPILVELPVTNDVPAAPSQRIPWREDETRKNWVMRLLKGEDRDPRSAPRESLPGLVAYFFTGGAPKPDAVRDMSMTGLYLVTRERWYMGTVVQMTLTNRNRSIIGPSMSLYAQAVRSESDGVGFRFVLEEDRHRHDRVIEPYGPTNGINRMQVGRFMEQFKATDPAAQ